MYTRDDYLRDLYVAEYGEGAEQIYARKRAHNYELGDDPSNIAYIGSDAYIREQKARKTKPILLIPKIIIVIIVADTIRTIIAAIF